MKNITIIIYLLVVIFIPGGVVFAQDVYPTEPPAVTGTPEPITTEPPAVTGTPEPITTEPPAITETPEPIIPMVVSTTIPVAPELRAAVNAWLAVSPPADAVYYGITYTQQKSGNRYYVCLVALNISAPDDPWSFTEDKNGRTFVTWAGTIIISFLDDGYSVEMYAPDPGIASHGGGAKVAMPLLSPSYGPGGGPYVRFPWQPSKAAIFGIRGIHGVGYDNDIIDGWRAIDLVSGSEYGSGSANDSVYASVPGTVDYVCQDSESVAVRVSSSEDSFVYAHFLDNDTLVMDHEFSAGDVMGKLRHGSFSGDLVGNCGWAVQKENNWHLHWGFIIEQNGGNGNGNFQAEGCILTTALGAGVGEAYVGIGTWQCGQTEIKVNQPLIHYGNITDIVNYGTDDGTFGSASPSASGVPSLWTMIEAGIGSIFDVFVGNVLPEHNTPASFFLPITNGVKIVFRIVGVLLMGYFNLGPAIAFMSSAIYINITLNVIFLAGTILRIMKSIPFIP